MTECARGCFAFPSGKRRQVEAEFSGGDITSDGGLLLLKQADKRLGLLEAVNVLLPDPRDQRYVQHDQLTLLRRRVYALCQGYEDPNDHNDLRRDPAFQMAVGRMSVWAVRRHYVAWKTGLTGLQLSPSTECSSSGLSHPIRNL